MNKPPGLLGTGMRSLLIAQGVTILWLSIFFDAPTATKAALVQGNATPYPLYTFLALNVLAAIEWLDSSRRGSERWPYVSAMIWFAWGATVFLQSIVLATLPTQLWPLIMLYVWLAKDAFYLAYFIQHRWTV